MRVAAFALLPALASCGEPQCANRVTQRELSPNGDHEAVVYERDCGATTAYATHVQIGTPGSMPQGASDLFVASRGNMHLDWANAEARVEWSGPASLTIIHDSLSELFERERRHEGVTITYRQQGL